MLSLLEALISFHHTALFASKAACTRDRPIYRSTDSIDRYANFYRDFGVLVYITVCTKFILIE